MSDLVLIIGGTSGIGLETAEYLLNKNYRVIICGRRKIISSDIDLINANVNSDKSVKDLYNIVQKKFGEINSLVFAAGITTNKKHIEDFDEKIWNEVIDTNVTGLLRVLKHFFPSLMKTKGRIAVVNSIASKKSSPFSGFEYTISKAALSGLVKQLAVEWAKYNIYINSVFPSMTLTPMLKKNLNNNEIKTLQEKLPLKKFSDPLDTARAIEFLISKKNKYITGSGIDVSGGQFLSG